MKKSNPPTCTENFTGIFRLTGRIVDFDSHGTPYLRLRLSHFEGDHIAGLDVDHVHVPEDIGYLDLIKVAGIRCPKNPLNLDVRLIDIHKACPAEANAQPVLNSMPRVYCPVPSSLDMLVGSVRSLSSPHLKHFIRRVIERKDRLESFLNAPASRSHHHAYPGGLLEHSVDVARNVVAMIQLNEPNMPRLLQELGFVAGLLHDIGKTYTYDSKGKPNLAWRLCDHHALTLEACAFGLAYLDRHEPELAITLRHIWTSASPGARYGTQPANTLARYVRDADGQSAMAHRQKSVFQGIRHGLVKKGKELFWSPAV
ncbi:phosphohydrolase [Billgrantia diversa]|uniref:TraI domain-containing protein n=1 Tax=Halomonas sp. MCCC 1A13316 TaxID=2733487 RepID=UPI0018A37490|nr:TraI domain-containing protein [Halomonas sp. MCCC 1A13316]QOR37456.1 phosphohydrolase [Halomonas sp. MCCC 1A13316]